MDRFEPDAVLASTAPDRAALPQRLLYATSAGIGGTGLDSTSLEGALASHKAGILRRTLAFGVGTKAIPRGRIHSLNWHPVRLLSWLKSDEYYAAKKRYVDTVAALTLRTGSYDAFHGWSGDCFRSLVEARLKGVPTVIDIPTWHRNKGADKTGETRSEREARQANRGWRDWRKNLIIDRPRMLAEYDLADVILVPSRKAAETFLAAGIPESKLHYVARGVDPSRYSPGEPPTDVFRLIFVGALIKRKGVHHLLAAWRKLNLKNAELLLVGTLHEEMKPFMAEMATANVKHLGFSSRVQDELRRSSAFVFPSECEGFAKVTLEAAACALPIITTAESGDAVAHGENGWLIPPNDEDALAAAIQHFHTHRDEIAAMGRNGRQRVLRCLTWDHYRSRVLRGYALAKSRV
ncbi:MAG: glycosyltransferase family 1 protein [Verrucomicrobiaceae bacterium]|nr:glycosyltransferase family 1 protein [Verrucomicrobiaceae bacterium]